MPSATSLFVSTGSKWTSQSASRLLQWMLLNPAIRNSQGKWKQFEIANSKWLKSMFSGKWFEPEITKFMIAGFWQLNWESWTICLVSVSLFLYSMRRWEGSEYLIKCNIIFFFVFLKYKTNIKVIAFRWVPHFHQKSLWTEKEKPGFKCNLSLLTVLKICKSKLGYLKGSKQSSD